MKTGGATVVRAVPAARPVTSAGGPPAPVDPIGGIDSDGTIDTGTGDPANIGTGSTDPGDPVDPGGRTRDAVVRLLADDGPLTASELSHRLHISPAGIRRHLDQLTARGDAVVRSVSTAGPRGRGRPARAYLLSESGRARLPHAYDRLAVDALEFLASVSGAESIAVFARQRAEAVVGAVRPDLAATPDLHRRTELLAAALTDQGFAASVAHMPGGDQICQHHCPVAGVARSFPQFCEAETAALTEALGSHGQRLATIARGDSFCTTFIPTPAVRAPHRPGPRSTHHQEGTS